MFKKLIALTGITLLSLNTAQAQTSTNPGDIVCRDRPVSSSASPGHLRPRGTVGLAVLLPRRLDPAVFAEASWNGNTGAGSVTRTVLREKLAESLAGECATLRQEIDALRVKSDLEVGSRETLRSQPSDSRSLGGERRVLLGLLFSAGTNSSRDRLADECYQTEFFGEV